MKGVFLQPSFRSAHSANRGARSREHGHGRGEEVPAPLARLAVLGATDVLRELGVSESGLSAAEVQRRRAQWGVNRIAHERRELLALQVLRRLANPRRNLWRSPSRSSYRATSSTSQPAT